LINNSSYKITQGAYYEYFISKSCWLALYRLPLVLSLVVAKSPIKETSTLAMILRWLLSVVKPVVWGCVIDATFFASLTSMPVTSKVKALNLQQIYQSHPWCLGWKFRWPSPGAKSCFVRGFFWWWRCTFLTISMQAHHISKRHLVFSRKFSIFRVWWNHWMVGRLCVVALKTLQ